MRWRWEVLVGCWVTAALGCGGGGNSDAATHNPLTVTAPLPLTDVNGGVRNVIVTARADQRQANEMASCTLEADLFDLPAGMTMQSITPTMVAGECSVYAPNAAINLSQEQWVCAGAVFASYNGAQQALGLCPSAGAHVTPFTMVDCTGLTPGASVQISSGSEVPNDQVTDLMGMATFPGAITFVQPTTIGVTTWAAGDLMVEWNSTNATAAVLVLQAQDTTAPSATIVCRPATNGEEIVPDRALAASGLRSAATMLRVFSYHDTTTTAEMGHTYHLFAGLESAVLLQPH